MTPLESGQLRVMRIHGAINAAVLLVLAVGAGAILHAAEAPVPAWLPAAIVAVLVVYPCLIAPPRRFRAWGYRVGPGELHVAHGVWTRVRTVVPFVRVQHIDVGQGPIERSCGVSRLVLHTAGTAHSLVTLPGLTPETAERLRDEIRAHIREDS